MVGGGRRDDDDDSSNNNNNNDGYTAISRHYKCSERKKRLSLFSCSPGESYSVWRLPVSYFVEGSGSTFADMAVNGVCRATGRPFVHSFVAGGGHCE